MTRFIGLTGGIGAGKSEALAAASRLGAATISTDQVAHEVLESPEVRKLLVERWGDEVIGADGGVDRARISGIVFEKPNELAWLESQTHPRVGAAVAEWRAAVEPGTDVAVLEIPLLFEAGLDAGFDETVAVIASDDIREARLAERGQGGLEGREARQLSQDEKASRADHVIRNDGTIEELEQAMAGILKS